LAEDNQLNLLEEAARKQLKSQLDDLMKRAPQLHISFATDPQPKVVEEILNWLRSNVHPETLLIIGLQPSIAAGCMLRTPNKIFDMSLRQHLENQESFLKKLIQGVRDGQ
jgi:F0F1-type ATP synthase delta subunit